MTVKIKWDADADKTGRPDAGTDTKQYPSGATSGTVTVTSEQDPTKTKTVTFTLPISGSGAALTPDKTSVDSGGDAAARTITVAGTGFTALTAGTVTLNTGGPGSGGTVLATANVTTDAAGAFTGATLVVPAGQAAGEYHLVGTVGTAGSDNTTITVTVAATPAIVADKTTVDSGGDEAERTVSVTGTGFTASATGTVAIHPGAPGSGGTAIVSQPVTTDAAGAFTATALIVPASQAAGDYHIVATVTVSSSDDTALAVTLAAQMDAPTNVAAGTVTTTTIPLTWDAVTTPVAAEGYIVRHAPTGTTTWTERPVVATAADTIDGLTANTGYDIQVKAQATDHTDSDWSVLITATTAA
jgi:hypothetical protein